MQDLQKRAADIGGAAAEVLPGLLAGRLSRANPVCLHAILDAAVLRPELNDSGLLCELAFQSLDYVTQAAPAAFQQSLRAAVEWCELVGIKIAVDFIKGDALKHRGMARMRPGVCDSLAILTELAKAGMFPRSEAAFLNCCKLIIDQNVPWIATREVVRIIGVHSEAFRRAAAGEPMVW